MHSSSKTTDIITINRLTLDSYTTLDLSFGLKKDSWSVELFGENLTDTRAQIAGNFVNDRARITTNRPLTGGIRFSWDY